MSGRNRRVLLKCFDDAVKPRFIYDDLHGTRRPAHVATVNNASEAPDVDVET